MYRIRILIISENEVVRRGLMSLFTSQDGFIVLDENESGYDIKLLQKLQPDVVLYDVSGHAEKKKSFISMLKEVCPCTLLIILSNLSEWSDMLATIAAGADGYLKIPILPADLVAAIELTCRSGVCFFPRDVRRNPAKLKSCQEKRSNNGESKSDFNC